MKVVFVHGLGAHHTSDLFSKIAEVLGFEPVYLKYWDITSSPGWTKIVIDYLKSQMPEEDHIIVGHSLGGALSPLLSNEKTKALIMLAPAFQIPVPFKIGLLAGLIRKDHVTLDFNHRVIISRVDMFRLERMKGMIKEISLPSLIITAGDDDMVDNEGVYRFYIDKMKAPAYFVDIKDATHSFYGKESEVADVVGFFLNRLINI